MLNQLFLPLLSGEAVSAGTRSRSSRCWRAGLTMILAQGAISPISDARNLGQTSSRPLGHPKLLPLTPTVKEREQTRKRNNW